LFETLKEISKLTLLSLKRQLDNGTLATAATRPAPRPTAPPPTAEPVHPVPPTPAAPAPFPAVPASLMTTRPPEAPAPLEAPAQGPPPWRPSAAAPEAPAPPAPAPAATRPRRRPEPHRAGASEPPAAKAPAAEAVLAAGNGHKDLGRQLELLLDAAALAEARTVAIDLQVRDASERVLHQIRDFAWDIAGLPAADDVRLQLQIALRPKR
jgi:outer membrane biosynthesis protein TonB